MSGASFAVRNVTAVLPNALLENAVVVVEDGVIVDVSQRAAPPNAVDGNGVYCLPGLVDTHNDGLEREVMPRPSTRVPVEFALRAFESRIRAAGITTLFHGISWENDSKWNRTVELAKEFSLHIAEYRESNSSLIDHRLLHRLDARDGDGSDALRTYLKDVGAPHDFGGDTPLVSFEDHTPGQGQYTDRSGLVRYLMGTRGWSAEQAEVEVENTFLEREAKKHYRTEALGWIIDAADRGHIRLIGHDLATPAEVEEATEWGAHIAEFPTTIEAARLSRERELRIVCGAPNVMRGGSHSGNVGALELIRSGLCDGLCSDYLPYSMIESIPILVDEGACTLPRAVRLVTRGPAVSVGLEDRGLVAKGMRGDLVLARIGKRTAQVLAVLTSQARASLITA
jgi:alpha-D-ribose 1-methylphosphonate 5-triphosphate diphosphatase